MTQVQVSRAVVSGGGGAEVLFLNAESQKTNNYLFFQDGGKIIFLSFMWSHSNV